MCDAVRVSRELGGEGTAFQVLLWPCCKALPASPRGQRSEVHCLSVCSCHLLLASPCLLESQAASFTDDDFPSLGATPSGSSGTSSSRTAVSEAAGYARKAKAAAHLPSPTARRRGPPVSTASQSRPAAAAPIWQADGVQQFSTGAALAAEYAAQRAEARDHARLRNACFQQV